MKRVNLTAKKYVATAMAAVTAVAMLAGCGKAEQPAVVEETAETAEATVNAPFLSATEKYNEFISELSDDKYYAFADACQDYDLLLVTDGVYDNLDGNMATIDATVYGLDEAGDVVELGTVYSNGTAYPLAVYDGCLIYGGNHHMGMSFVENGNMITKLDATEEFDTSGNATYYLFDLDNQFEGEVEDDSKLMEMYELYSQATVINFFSVSGETNAAAADTQTTDAADIAGTYTYSYTEEIEGNVIEVEDSVVLNDNNTCEVSFQDTIPGVWSDGVITLDSGEEYEFTVDGDVLNLNMNGEIVSFTK